MPHVYRTYCPSRSVAGNRIVIDIPERVHHIRDVLRLGPKDALSVFDDSGAEYACIIDSCGKNSIVLSVQGRSVRRAGLFSLTVACALPKKSAMDDIVDSLTQLGAARIIPMITERTVVRPNKTVLTRKTQRWQKIALSSTQQCGRPHPPLLEAVCTFSEALEITSDCGMKLIPTLEGDRRHITDFARLGPETGELAFLIGPEGDFSPAEVKDAKTRGFIPVSLGDLVLRVDTAAVAVASFFHFCADYRS